MNHRDAENLTFELLETWSTFNHYAKEAQTFKNPEDIHQARIRLRKLTTFAKLVNQTEEPIYLIWKRLMEAFGQVRDVMSNSANNPSIRRLNNYSQNICPYSCKENGQRFWKRCTC